MTFYDLKTQKKSSYYENLPPKYNEQRGCYTLNFFGRVNKPSARNFQLIEKETSGDEVFLIHGKI